VKRLKIHQLEATGTLDATTVLRGDGTWATIASGSGDSGAVDRVVGTGLVKQGIVLAKGAGGTWDADLVESPTIILDPKSGKLAMVYVGYGTTSGAQRAGVGLAYSDDGLTWTKYGTAAILPHSGTGGAADQNGCSGPLLLWDDANNQYVLYYIGLTATGYEAGTKTICRATATSLTGTWTRHGAVITTGTGWRANAVWHPSVVERDGTWYMFFNASNASDVETIGYATAPDINGPWTVDDVNSPLLSGATGWEDDNVGDPSLVRIGNVWVMHYYGVDFSPLSASDGIAVTPDASFPLGWTRYPNNPVLAPGASYDAKFAHKPFVMYRGGTLYHYYTAVSAADVRQIACATEGPVGTAVTTTRAVNTDSTLTGGGDLSADRTLGVDTTAEAERIRDVIGSALVAGSNITITVSDVGDTITIAAAGGTSSGELLMQDGVSAPPVPIENEARTDWLYQG
jgi:predicted GH43/DUF377 family glycosyl hydrolase